MQSHPVLISTDLLLPKTLNDIPLPRPRARRLQIDDRAIVRLQVIPRVEMRSLQLLPGRGIGGVAHDLPVWIVVSYQKISTTTATSFE